MINIREGVFETNSSSTHSMVIVPDSQLKSWESGDVFYIGDCWALRDVTKDLNTDFLDKSQISKAIKLCNTKLANEGKDYTYFEGFKGKFDSEDLEILSQEEVFTYESYMDYHSELEEDDQTYTSEHGDIIHVICHYGYDG